MTLKTILISFTTLGVLLLPLSVLAQRVDYDSLRPVWQADSLFWEAYNACDVAGMMQFVAEDFEFYHDRGGLTEDKGVFETGLENGLCAESGYRTRRVAVPNSLVVHPVPGHGAIMEGDHLFYERAPGGQEYLAGKARFTHVWVNQAGQWQMTRVLSYGHTPATTASLPNAAYGPLSEAELQAYTGEYESANTGKVTISLSENGLVLSSPRFEFTLHPQAPHQFALPDRPVVFQFEADSEGNILGFVVQENGLEQDRLVKQK
ncbi:MAG TPA: hypothetical protein DCE41_37655 [Cytophagales bacterium]|nr:hypothetical protein [Cytophagales bacterium]HAA20766.1 hypothetical protein [Cytophagales bacterium]HAP60196.1 hypothetical protein [Cytophagales bacterium]